MAWAFASAVRKDEALFAVLATVADWRVGSSTAQDLANTAWALATAARQDAALFAALARAAEGRESEFNVHELSNMAWAFATAGEPVPAMLNPISVLDAMTVQGAKLQWVDYQMSMQSLVVTGQIAAGFELLTRAEADGL